MAIVKKNVLTQGLSGNIGGTIVFRQVGDRTIVTSAPTPTHKPPTDKQLQQRQRFQEAVIYARAQHHDPDMQAEYEAEGAQRGISAFNAAVADFLDAPDIQEIDLTDYTGDPGDTIRVRVTDGGRVEQVSVTITNSNGTQVESGNAVEQDNGLDWVYTIKTANASLTGDKITIRAQDHPGNITEEERTL